MEVLVKVRVLLFGVKLKAACVGGLLMILAVAVAVQPVAEVTVTVYVPAASPVAEAVFWLLLQWKV